MSKRSKRSKRSKKEQYIQSLNQWYADQDERLLTAEAIDNMSKAYDNEILTEGRIYQSKLIAKE